MEGEGKETWDGELTAFYTSGLRFLDVRTRSPELRDSSSPLLPCAALTLVSNGVRTAHFVRPVSHAAGVRAREASAVSAMHALTIIR